MPGYQALVENVRANSGRGRSFALLSRVDECHFAFDTVQAFSYALCLRGYVQLGALSYRESLVSEAG